MRGGSDVLALVLGAADDVDVAQVTDARVALQTDAALRQRRREATSRLQDEPEVRTGSDLEPEIQRSPLRRMRAVSNQYYSFRVS